MKNFSKIPGLLLSFSVPFYCSAFWLTKSWLICIKLLALCKTDGETLGETLAQQCLKG